MLKSSARFNFTFAARRRCRLTAEVRGRPVAMPVGVAREARSPEGKPGLAGKRAMKRECHILST